MSSRTDLALTGDQEKPPVVAWFVSQEQTTLNTCDNNNNHRGGMLIKREARMRPSSVGSGLRADDYSDVLKRNNADQVMNKDMIMDDDRATILMTTSSK